MPAQGQTPQTSRPRPTSSPRPTGTRCRCRPAARGCRSAGDTSVYLAGTATQLQPGDAILIVGDERDRPTPTSEQWDVRHRHRGQARQRQRPHAGHLDGGPRRHGERAGADEPASSTRCASAPRCSATTRSIRSCCAEDAAARSPRPASSTGIPTATGISAPTTSTGEQPRQRAARRSRRGLLQARARRLARADRARTADTSRSPAGFVSLYRVEVASPRSRARTTASAPRSAASRPTPTRSISSLLLCSHALDLGRWPRARRCRSPSSRSTIRSTAPSSISKIVRADLAGVTAVAVTGQEPEAHGQPPASARPLVRARRRSRATVALKPGDTLTAAAAARRLRTPTARFPTGSTATGALTLAVADASGRTGTVAAALVGLHPRALRAPAIRSCRNSRWSPRYRWSPTPFPHTRIVLHESADQLLRPHARRR